MCNNMKKLLLVILAALTTTSASAQYNTGDVSITESTVYYGGRIGIDFASLTGDNTSGFCMRTGFNLGVIVGVHISERTPICIETGIYYTERGAKLKKDDYKQTTSLGYLELPVLVKYGFDIGNGMAVLPYVGPYFSLGVGGKIKDNIVSVSSFADAYNRFDMGFKLGCGFEWNHLYLETGYQLGVANIAQESVRTTHGNAIYINFGINL